MHTRIQRMAVILLAALILLIPWSQARSETFMGTNIDSRVIIGLKTQSSAVQDLLPQGWTAIAFPRGPLTGANLLVSFVDGILMVDADGAPLAPASRRAVIFLGLAKQDGGDAVRIYVLRSYTSAPEDDPYGVNVAADITRSNALTGPANGGRASRDDWSMTAGDGTLAMSLSYTTGKRSWSASEALSYSAANPDFHRIYRYDSITDLVMSTVVGKPTPGDFSLTNSVPDLAAISDGNEETVAILDIPVRVRKVYLP